ncbi:hypothetical protein D3C78_1530380 [compost metagenome]
MVFWLLRLSAMVSGVMPSAARRSCENSTYTRLACLPMTSIFLTIGTLSMRRLMSSVASDRSAWPMPSPLTAYIRPYTSPYSSLTIGPITPSGSSRLRSFSFLRAWYQASRWSALEVPPRTVSVMPA